MTGCGYTDASQFFSGAGVKKWDDAIEWFSVGAGASAAGAAGVALITMGATQEAFFSLFGAIIGASATIAGAAWLADRNTRSANAQERQSLEKEIGPLLEIVRGVQDDFRSGLPYTDEFLSSVHVLRAAALETPAVLQEALDHAKTLDFKQRVKVMKLRASVKRFHSFYSDDLFDEAQMHPEDTRDWPTTLGDLAGCLLDLNMTLERR